MCVEKNLQFKSLVPIFKLVGSFVEPKMAELGNTAFLTEFIDIYRQLPCLWKIKSKSYSNRQEKNKAYEKLLSVLKKADQNATIDSVKKKINNLRSAFRKELKKVRKSKRSGEGSDNIYVPTLWYFNLLMFTADQEEPRKSVSNDTHESDEETENESDFQNDFNEIAEDDNSCFSIPDTLRTPLRIDTSPRTSSTTSTSQPPSRTPSRSDTIKTNSKKRSRESIIEKACESLYSQNADEFDAVGNNVACKLRRMNENQKILAEHLIHKIVLLGIQNKLNDYSDITSNRNNGFQLCTSQNYEGSNPNQANTSSGEINFDGNKANYHYNTPLAGPSNATAIYADNNPVGSHQNYEQELSQFVTFQKL